MLQAGGGTCSGCSWARSLMRASWCHIAPWLFGTRRGEGYFDEQSGQAAGELGNYWVTRSANHRTRLSPEARGNSAAALTRGKNSSTQIHGGLLVLRTFGRREKQTG